MTTTCPWRVWPRPLIFDIVKIYLLMIYQSYCMSWLIGGYWVGSSRNKNETNTELLARVDCSLSLQRFFHLFTKAMALSEMLDDYWNKTKQWGGRGSSVRLRSSFWQSGVFCLDDLRPKIILWKWNIVKGTFLSLVGLVHQSPISDPNFIAF